MTITDTQQHRYYTHTHRERDMTYRKAGENAEALPTTVTRRAAPESFIIDVVLIPRCAIKSTKTSSWKKNTKNSVHAYDSTSISTYVRTKKKHFQCVWNHLLNHPKYTQIIHLPYNHIHTYVHTYITNYYTIRNSRTFKFSYQILYNTSKNPKKKYHDMFV